MPSVFRLCERRRRGRSLLAIVRRIYGVQPGNAPASLGASGRSPRLQPVRERGSRKLSAVQRADGDLSAGIPPPVGQNRQNKRLPAEKGRKEI